MFVEAVRLLITLAMLVAGFNLGRLTPGWFSGSVVDPGISEVWGAVLGAGVGYVAGGVVGRAIDRGLARAPQTVSKASGAELFAGAFGVITGIIVGAVLAVPTIVLLPANVGWPVAGLIVLVLAAFGARVFAARADDFLSAAGLRRAARRVPGVDDAGDRALVDTSAAIDGRILELAKHGLLRDNVWVTGFVIDELQAIADSDDVATRRRGRRGLDVLDAMHDVEGVAFMVLEDTVPEHAEVDAKLITLASRLAASLITTDHNLAKAAGLRGVRVINPHAVGESLRPPVTSGEVVEVRIEREGNEPGQGVAFLDDGTMVVVAGAASAVGRDVAVEVTNTLRTAVGRMAFATLVESSARAGN